MKLKIHFSLCVCKQDFEFHMLFSNGLVWGNLRLSTPWDISSPESFYIIGRERKKVKNSDKDRHLVNVFIVQAFLRFYFYICHLMKP